MMLEINGHDATSYFEVERLQVTDNAGGRADAMELVFDPSNAGFYVAAPQVGDEIRATVGGYDSGNMFVDETRQTPEAYTVGAVSAPPAARVPRNQGWEDVRLTDVLEEVALRCGLGLEVYAEADYRYRRLKQEDETDLDFLRKRCMLECWTMKVYNGKIIVYDAVALANDEPGKTMAIEGSYSLMHSRTAHFDAVRLKTIGLTAEYRQGDGNRVLELSSIPFFSLGEGERYCKGILHAQNRHIKRLTFASGEENTFAAGGVIGVTGEGELNGKYLIDRVRWDGQTGAATVEAGGMYG